jgi:hypothetical protein
VTRAKKSRPVVLAVTSDQHCGSTVALSPHLVALDDGGSYAASNAQRWLWACWLDYWSQVQAKRKALGADLYQVFNGDLTDGDHHGTTQILSGNPVAQAAVVDACMRVPLALEPDRLWFIRGTEAHVGKSGCFEERIANGLRKDGRPVVGDDATGNASHWHAKIDVQGVRFDFAHHGSVGTRPWTKPNATNNLAAAMFYDHAKDGVPHPHLAVRSHMHQWVDTYDAHPVRVVQIAAWQLATAFIHRIAPGKLADVGGLIVTVDQGQMTVEKVQFKPEPTPTWRAA